MHGRFRSASFVFLALLLLGLPNRLLSAPQSGLGSPDPAAAIPADWWSAVAQDIAAAEYSVTWQPQTSLCDAPAAFHAPNRAQNLRTYFTTDGIRIVPRDSNSPAWEWSLALVSFGRGTQEQVKRADLCNVDNRIEYDRGEIIEWYVNDHRGIEQGFTVLEPPTSAVASPEVRLTFQLGGDVRASLADDSQSIQLTSAIGLHVLSFGQLFAHDATGRPLAARFELETPDSAYRNNIQREFRDAQRLSLVVEDSDAIYPITIDPLATSPSWTAESDQASANFGVSASCAGDVNGDGFSDVIVGANLYDNGQNSEGRAFVYLGSAAGLATSPAWFSESNQISAELGFTVGSAGDINGDGFSDVIVGAYRYDNGQTDEGAAFVWNGSAAGLGVDGTPANADWLAESNQGSSQFGFSTASAGDINGDGFSDVIVGAFAYDNGQTDEGAAFVWLGSAAGLGPNGTSANADWLAESNQLTTNFGGAVGTAGDVNGDGFADVIVGSRFYDNPENNEGGAFLWQGSAAGLGPNGTPANADWTADPNQASAQFGYALGAAGDVNADGYADVIVGARFHDNGQTDEGRAFVYHGSASGLSASPNWTAEGNQISAWFGFAVNTAGDANGDGYSDVIVSAYQYDNGQTDEGRAYVYEGSSQGLSDTPAWIGESNQATALYGAAVASAGDVNRDGYADVIIGSTTYDNGQTDEGRAFAYYGGPDGPSNIPNWTTESGQANAGLGVAVSSAGDVNGDGYSDILVGAWLYDNGQTDEGRAYVFHGAASGPGSTPDWTAEGDQDGARFAVAVSSAGDVNGDGYADVLVGAYLYDNGQTDEGRAFAFHGSPVGLSSIADWSTESNQDSADFGAAVASAGDINNDGFADVIIGAPLYDNGISGDLNAGRAFVYHGSPSGLGTSANWFAESNQTNAQLGGSVASAGSANGDRFSDVIVGADFYDNGQDDEGAAFVWLGGASGLGDNGTPLNADWSAEGNQADARFGVGVAGAGDVNGDGFSDVIIGSWLYDNGQNNEGRAFVYHGRLDPTALSETPNWTAEGDQASAFFGICVAGAGDVNGDGLSDVIVGASFYNNGEIDEGRAYAFLGSPSVGLGTLPAWTAESNQAVALFGNSLASAGDVNADGFADVIVGAYLYDNGDTDEGRAYLYYGDGRGGVSFKPQQRRADDTAPVSQLGRSDSLTEFRLALLGKAAFGRSKVKFEYEVKPLGTPLIGIGTQQTLAFTDTGTTGAPFNELVSGLTEDTAYHWRVRLLYDPITSPYQPVSRWITMPVNAWSELDLTTRSPAVPPQFNQHPADQTVCGPTSVMFTVAATGTPPPTFQWRKDTNPLADGGNISGATTATLTIDPATSVDNGAYDCVATNVGGSPDSNDATLTVFSPIPGDVNGDGFVDGLDIESFTTVMIAAGPIGNAFCAADLATPDGVVDFADLDAFVLLLTGP